MKQNIDVDKKSLNSEPLPKKRKYSRRAISIQKHEIREEDDDEEDVLLTHLAEIIA